MIIISDKPGQLGNLLFVYSNFLAYGLENDVKIFNPAFHRYKAYFRGTSDLTFINNKIVYTLCFLLSRILHRLKIKNNAVKVVALSWDEKIDLENAPSLKNGLCFTQGWLFRSDRLLTKYKSEIIDFFSLKESDARILKDFFAKHFQTNETMIGVHIRRGDYKTFENGKYFYTLQHYINIMLKLVSLFKNSKVRFLICSNEKYQAQDFGALQHQVTLALNHELLDLYSLAKCHYIIGPPSTYSMWASFYGNVPLCLLHEAERDISFQEFKISKHS